MRESPLAAGPTGGVRPGDKAPDFNLKAQDSRYLRLSDVLKKEAVVLFFYQRDFHGACTAEASGFRYAYDTIRSLGATVIGISRDNVSTHSRFAMQLGLPYRILSDPDGAVQAAYWPPTSYPEQPLRLTFIIDRRGTVRQVLGLPKLSVGEHIVGAVATLRQLATR